MGTVLPTGRTAAFISGLATVAGGLSLRLLEASGRARRQGVFSVPGVRKRSLALASSVPRLDHRSLRFDAGTVRGSGHHRWLARPVGDAVL